MAKETIIAAHIIVGAVLPNRKSKNRSNSSNTDTRRKSRLSSKDSLVSRKRNGARKQSLTTKTPTTKNSTTKKKPVSDHGRGANGNFKAVKTLKENKKLKPQANSPLVYDKPHFIEVDTEHDGQRIDNFLVTRLKGVPKAHIYRIIRKGEIRVNKGRVKQTTRLSEGDSIRIPPIKLSSGSDQNLDGARYEFLNKTIVYEDDALLVINKPSGMAVHAGSGIRVGVIEAMRALRSDLKYLELVHRLDRETSGCLVMAKRSAALKALNEDFKTNSLKNKQVDKRYLALVIGAWKFGQRRITKPLNTESRKHGERHVVVDSDGSYSSSIVSPVATDAQASLVEVKLLTGRTHQARVHLQSEGHPIVGDRRYGDESVNKVFKQHKLSRLFLHASQLTFKHPVSGEQTTVTAELPNDLTAVLEAINLCIN